MTDLLQIQLCSKVQMEGAQTPFDLRCIKLFVVLLTIESSFVNEENDVRLFLQEFEVRLLQGCQRQC